MQETLKVTLPPWRRGDGKPCKEPGFYYWRRNGQCFSAVTGGFFTRHLSMFEEYEYSGPIEFIETPPEVEPIVLEYGKVEVYLDDDPSQLATRKWVCTQRQKGTGRLLILTSGTTNVQAIEMHNAAVRAMEGKS